MLFFRLLIFQLHFNYERRKVHGCFDNKSSFYVFRGDNFRMFPYDFKNLLFCFTARVKKLLK